MWIVHLWFFRDTWRCAWQPPNASVLGLTCTGWRPLCHMLGWVGSPPSYTWYSYGGCIGLSFHWALSLHQSKESLCPIVELTSEAVLVLASHSPCWSASTLCRCSRTGRVGESVRFRSILIPNMFRACPSSFITNLSWRLRFSFPISAW